MIDERFSAASFAALGLDTDEARKLAKLLEHEILGQLDEVVVERVGRIVESLNGLGHKLKPEYAPEPGDLSYRDDWEDANGYHCRLRIGVDIVVSTGYAHLIHVPDDQDS